MTPVARLIHGERARNPLVLELARLAVVAARVEPELLRRLRMDGLPGTDASLEAELWFSRLVSARGAEVMAFSPQVLVALREEVRAAPDDEGAKRHVRAVAATIAEVHAAAPPLVRLEDALIAGLLTGIAESEVEALLRQVLGSLIQEPARRPGLTSWIWAALPGLPFGPVLPPSAGPLLVAASLHKRAAVPMSSTFSSGVLAHLPSGLLPPSNGDDIDLEVQRAGGHLVIGHASAGSPSARRFAVPNTRPRYVEVERASGTCSLVALDPGARSSVVVGSDVVRLRNLRGEEWTLVNAPHTPSAPRGLAVLVSGTADQPSPEAAALASAVGRALADAGLRLITGGASGVDAEAGRAFVDRLEMNGIDPAGRLTQILPHENTPSVSAGSLRRVNHLDEWFIEQLALADAIVLVEGRGGTELCYLLGRDADIPVFPLGTRGAALFARERIRESTGPGQANSDGREPDAMSEAQRASRDVRAMLEQVAPAQAAEAIAHHLRSTPGALSPSHLRHERMHAIWLATNYLWAQGLDASDPFVSRLRSSYDRLGVRDLLQERWRLHSRFAADRVIGYVCIQAVPQSSDARLLLETADVELAIAGDHGETRPLWQWLLSIQRLLDRSVVGENARRLLERVAGARELLESRTELDSGGECRDLVARALERLAFHEDRHFLNSRAVDERSTLELLKNNGPERARQPLERWFEGQAPDSTKLRTSAVNGVAVATGRGLPMLSISDGGLDTFEGDSELKIYQESNHLFADLLGAADVRWPIVFHLSRQNPPGAKVELLEIESELVSLIYLGPGYSLVQVVTALHDVLVVQNVWLTVAWFRRHLLGLGIDPVALGYDHFRALSFSEERFLLESRTLINQHHTVVLMPAHSPDTQAILDLLQLDAELSCNYDTWRLSVSNKDAEWLGSRAELLARLSSLAIRRLFVTVTLMDHKAWSQTGAELLHGMDTVLVKADVDDAAWIREQSPFRSYQILEMTP